MGPLANRLGRVLTIYTSRRWWMLGLLVFATLLAIQFSLEYTSDPHRIGEDSMPLIAIPALTLPWILVLAVKPQFAHPRAVLMPGFLAPHLAIPAVVLFILLVAFPASVAIGTNCDPLGLCALACACAVPILWSMHALRFLGFFVSIGVVFWAAKDNAATEWWALPNNDLTGVRLSIVVIGVAASAAWLWRLSQLREETDDYRKTVRWPLNTTTRIESAANSRPVTREFIRWAAVFYDRWHERLRDRDTASLRGRMRLLEYGLSAWPLLLSSLAFGVYFLLLEVFLGVLMPHSMRGTQHALLGFLLLLSLCATPWTSFKTHRPQMAGELMFPMSRKQLVDGLFATLARQIAAQWIAGCAVALPIVALFPCESTTLPAVGTLLLFATSIQVIVFGLGAYIAAWSSRELQNVAMGLLGGSLFVLCMVLIFSLPDPWTNLVDDLGLVPIFLLTLLQSCVGLAIIKMAHRKWLNLELG